MNTKPQKVAIYCRLSEEDRNKESSEDDSNSIKNQKSMLIKYAMDQNWEIYNIYSDDDYAGADRKRPEFNKLLNDAEEKKFNIILCKTQSRFTRELELVEKYIHGLFPILGIRFVSIVDNADTDNKGNKKSRQINGLVNEWYLEDMSDNIRSVLTDRRKSGFHIGAFALYGYKKDPDQKGHLLIDEEAAKVVREVFEAFSNGMGKTAIARMLNDRGIPNPTEYKRLNGLRYKQPKRKNSTLWKYFAISDMLTNEIYIGNMVQGKYGSVSYKTKQNKPRPKENWYIVEGTHEPIINNELWNRVQDLVKLRAKPFDTGNIGIFARKVFCANCGYTMRTGKSRGKHYFKCSSRHISKDSCIGSFIMQDVLEKAILQELKALLQKYLDKDNLEKSVEFNFDSKEKKQALKNEKTMYESKIKETMNLIKDLYIDKVKGVISDDIYKDLSKDFEKEKIRFEKLVSNLEVEIEKLDKQQIKNNDIKNRLEKYIKIESLNREIVDELIESIYVQKRNKETRELAIQINWKI